MPTHNSRIIEFWQELKRRNVGRVVTVYAAAAFVILELVSILAPSLGLPEWTLNLVLLLLCVGFVIAVILSWIYDIHPEVGMVKTEPAHKVKAEEKPKSSNSWKIASYISFGVIIALIVINTIPRNRTSEESSDIEKSIAILPFKNISPDSSNQYLLDGIMEAVLNYLTQVENVRVIASTSVQQYRETNKTISEIGNELNVNYVLEGSGQKYDENFRLTTKLSDTRTSTLIWSNPYDRKIIDILEFQSEIAQKIVTELQAELTTEERNSLAAKPTFSEKAYSNYLKADIIRITNPLKAIELLEEAIEIDPLFVDAYVLLSRIQRGRSAMTNCHLSSAEALKLSLPPIEKALKINPIHAGAHSQLGMIKFHLEWDFQGAEEQFKKAAEISGSPIYLNVALLVQSKRYDEALEVAEQQRDHDPISAFYNIMISYLFSGESEKALEVWNEWFELFPTAGINLGQFGRIYMQIPDYNNAIHYFNHAINIERIPFFLSDLAICYDKVGEKDKANQILDELIERYSNGELGSIAFMVGKIYAGTGNIDSSLEWLEKSFHDHELEMIWLYADPAFEIMQDNPQYIDLLKRVGFGV